MLRRSSLSFISVLAAGLAVAAVAHAEVSVAVDGVQRIALRGQAASVIVANPRIADVTVADANTLFITGKGYGVTEVVVVDAIGRTLFQNRVVVTGGQPGSVRVWRGAQPTEMVCASSCAPSVRTAGADGAPAAATPTP
jgi:Flp pilus assembly secretin CpaC